MKRLLIALGLLALSAPTFAQSGGVNAPSRMTVNNAVENQVMHEIRRPNHVGFQGNYDSKVLQEKLFINPGDMYKASILVADCLTKHAKADASALVGGFKTEDPNYDVLIKALTGRKYNVCAKKEAWGVPMNIINGALAESMIEEENPDLAKRAKGVDVAAAKPFYTDAGGKTIETVGRCLAVYSPGLMLELFATKPGTADEKAALDNLFARTPECGVSATPDFFTVDEQRSALAAGLYHWLHRG